MIGQQSLEPKQTAHDQAVLSKQMEQIVILIILKLQPSWWSENPTINQTKLHSWPFYAPPIILQIIQFVPPDKVSITARVSKKLNTLCKNNQMWRCKIALLSWNVLESQLPQQSKLTCKGYQ
ncbi:hypothetical protein BY996DRAFT_6554845 [Phakopsora pachyrhizi]|nr:hypothetical protein BY996DRAFT_6554845 [Phakopsora pachyrhizi]